MTSTTDPGLQQRLAYLRRRRGPDSFPDDEPSTGQDPTGAISLDVDASGWVITSRVDHLDGLRTPSDFAGAVRSAYTMAALARLAAEAQEEWRDREPTPERMQRGREIVEGRRPLTVPPRPLFRPIELPSHPVPDPGSPSYDPGLRSRHGSSRGGEITLAASVAGGLGAITVDGEWLATTGVELAHHALREAFHDLRERGAI
ncbi:MAG TPA: hypothetical protein VNS46_05095 [Nocardioides sp.]|nr:hypothetical protein [Nocardioides sp.]